MSGPKVPAILMVLSGNFESQPVAFEALLDEAENRGLTVDLADVDVIREAANVRLAHYFRPAIVARLQTLQGSDDTLILVRPSALAIERSFPPDGAGFRLLGKFAGLIVETQDQDDLA